MKSFAEYARRRQELIALSARQREAVAGAIRGLERPAALADRVVGVARSLRAHPVLLGALVAAAVAALAWRRGTVLGLAARGLAAWRVLRTLRAWARRLGLELPRSGRQQKTGHAAP